MRFWYLSHYRAAKAQACLRKCADCCIYAMLIYFSFTVKQAATLIFTSGRGSAASSAKQGIYYLVKK